MISLEEAAMSDNQTLTFEQTIAAPPAAVYRAFTNSSALREWLADTATTVPRPGGRVYLAWNNGYYTAGSFATLRPGEEVSLTWHGRDEPGPSSVHVALTPEGEQATHITVRHEGLGTSPEWEECVAALEAGLASAMENLASVLTTGEDLRFTRRPMLGITISDFDEEIAAELGVPVHAGIRLDGVLEGMGAAAAGLQAGDVVVSVDGRDVSDWASLASALSAHRAGDTVDVVYYRGAEQQNTAMTLSGRPIPDLPATLSELAEVVRHRYRQIEEELDDLFAGVDDTAAMHKAGPEEWSAAEVLAHLIHGERYQHIQIAELAGGHEGWHDDWGGNSHAQVAATVRAYPAVTALLDELKRHHVETVTFIENLPTEFLQRKNSYWRLAYDLLDTPFHHRAHLEQMRAAIEQAPAAEPA
jgi:uncharacterized protein YndB with AHSA1/START domain